MAKKCELCESPAKMYCESDQASLCWDCDNKVHGANFLVAKHTRALLCHVCQSLTPWNGSGPKLAPTISVCNVCFRNSSSSREEGKNGETGNDADDDVEHDEDEAEDEDDDDDDDDEENQVVPWSSTQPPPVSSSSTSDRESSSKLFNSEEGTSESQTAFSCMRHATRFPSEDNQQRNSSSQQNKNSFL